MVTGVRSFAAVATVLALLPPSGAAPKPTMPTVIVVEAQPAQLGHAGGTVNVRGVILGARICRLAVLADRGVEVRLPPPANCSAGTYDENVLLGGNPHRREVTVELGLFPYGLVRKDARTLSVQVAGQPTLQEATSEMSQAFPGNWSGYAVNGPQPYTSVTGTFTVPKAAPTVSCDDVLSEWVGIDGYGNGFDPWLVQAGVDAYSNSRCWQGGRNAYAWWELITPSSTPPNSFVTIWNEGPLAGSPATVGAGDRVTVTIDQVAKDACSPAAECWQIRLEDDTTGGAYVIDKPYSGPGASAEWIVENPDQPTVCPAYSGLHLCPLPSYSPPIAFSGLSTSPDIASGWTSFPMTAPGCAYGCHVVLQLSALSTPSLGFDVSYVPSSGATGSAPG